MPIFSSDGTPYQLAGSLQQYDPENPDLKLFNLWDQEAIQIGGSPIWYYKCLIQYQTLDKLYYEDKGKIWSPIGTQLVALYEPQSSNVSIGQLGYDGMIDVVFELNYQYVKDTLGEIPARGSKIFTPHKRETWVVINPITDEYKLWGTLRLKLYCTKFQEDRNENNLQMPQPDTPL